MKLKNNQSPLGSTSTKEPEAIEAIFKEYFRSNEEFAQAFLGWLKEKESGEEALMEDDVDACLFESLFPNTELAVDLKLITRKPGRLNCGDFVDGVIVRDDDEHFCFVQNTLRGRSVSKRNPHVYEGEHININRKADGKLYPTFNRPRYTRDFTFRDFCRAAADELYAITSNN